MSILDPKDDAKAFQPIIEKAEATLIDATVQQFIPALQKALTESLSGLTITIQVSKKGS